MDNLVNIISPDGLLNFASLLRLFLLMIGMDGVILMSFLILKGAK